MQIEFPIYFFRSETEIILSSCWEFSKVHPICDKIEYK